MPDHFASHAKGLEAPADRHYAIVPSDGADLPRVPRSVYCAAAGTAVLRDHQGTDLSYTLVAGQILPVRPVRVLATGTTATLYGWE